MYVCIVRTEYILASWLNERKEKKKRGATWYRVSYSYNHESSYIAMRRDG